MVTATLPAAANKGDRLDVSVSSVGDARSLMGGTLIMTPLLGPDQRTYALAQGQLVVGGYRFDAGLNSQQRNFPASGVLTSGASVETPVHADLVGSDNELVCVLKDADFTTAERVADAINADVGSSLAQVRGADSVRISTASPGGDIYRLISRIENVAIIPDARARVVVNERSGTVVAGGAVSISSVVISQGDVRVSVSTDNQASQPSTYGGNAAGARSLLVTNTKLAVTSENDAVVSFPNTTVADLVEGLNRAHVDTRGLISILQAMKAAGALHADIVVQ